MASSRRRKNRRQLRKRAHASPLDESAKQFGEEVNAVGKRFERKGNGFRDRLYSTFGVAGPLVSAVISLLMLSFGLWVLRFFVNETGSAVLLGVHDFLLANLGIFFAIFLISSCLKYCSIKCPRTYFLISPFAAAFGIAVFFWVAANAMLILNAEFGSASAFIIANLVLNNLFGIFWIFLLVGYFAVLLKIVFRQASCCAGDSENASGKKAASMSAAESKKGGSHRLYRSGKDKILGGVCGGIAEYLGVDPVLIRLLWVAFTLVGGAGILLYIIAWIIIPRNPKHKWK